jgi:hypothetical protein
VTHDRNRDDYWDKILSEIDMDYIPMEYMSTVVVKFLDGKEWEIDINKSQQNDQDVETILDDFFEEYQDTIDTVDFRLDLQQLKKDIGKRTHKFLKLNK